MLNRLLGRTRTSRREPRRNRLQLAVVNLALQQLQPLRVARFIRIHFRRPVQTLRSLGEVPRSAIHIEELQQSLAVVASPVRSVDWFALELPLVRRTPPRSRS